VSEVHHELDFNDSIAPRSTGEGWAIPNEGIQPFNTVVSQTEKQPPLVVDLDGTLVRSDLLVQIAFAELGQRPQVIIELLQAILRGKADLKHRLSEPVDFDPSTLPYDQQILHIARHAREQGRKVYLASASHERLVKAVADHLGIFDGWFATTADQNCASEMKAERLVYAFGEGGFDYIGNDRADLAVWRRARRSYAIRISGQVKRNLLGQGGKVEFLPDDKVGWRLWAKMLRVHQYAKNGLVLVPLLTDRQFDLESVKLALLAAVAFSVCASSVYIINDIVDLQDDRRHPTKCRRPLAAGQIPIWQAMTLVPLLLLSSLLLALSVSLSFAAVLGGYFALTTAYSFVLKRKLMLDVVALAGLYTCRLFGGAVAVSATLSPWLLAFMMSWFLALALVKRYTELIARHSAKMPDSKSRDYKDADIGMIGALAAGAAMNALTLFMLYIASDSVRLDYQRPEFLWLITPILACWIARVLMLAHRGQMNDDPVVFALKDKISLTALGIAGVCVIGAM